MKEIFVASSAEAQDKAERIAGYLSELPEIKPRLWKDEFKSGDITFLRIEELARAVAGAVIVATPDDHSTIRGKDALIPRANVLFEYGYFASALSRARVALCRYEPAELPSDLLGVTHIPMGRWPSSDDLSFTSRSKLKDWAVTLPQHALGRLKEEIANYEQRLRELRDTYKDVLDMKVEHERRNTWFQLTVLEEKLKEMEQTGRRSEISILGVNAIGPLHQGREILIRLLTRQGRLRLLLLDPAKQVFEHRSEHECDSVGRIKAEFYASLYIVMDILCQSKFANDSVMSSVEIRFHDQAPDRSLLMIDCDKEDGIVLDNPYPTEKGKRGMEGGMYPLVQRGRMTRGYIENVKYFNGLWQKARPITLAKCAGTLQIGEWPFSYF